jgi:hypothetical protein
LLIKTARERLTEKKVETRAVTDGRAPAARAAPANTAKAIEELEKSLQALEAKLVEEKKRVASSICSSVQVLMLVSICVVPVATNAILFHFF